jgi:hypothetical protein
MQAPRYKLKKPTPLTQRRSKTPPFKARGIVTISSHDDRFAPIPRAKVPLLALCSMQEAYPEHTIPEIRDKKKKNEEISPLTHSALLPTTIFPLNQSVINQHLSHPLRSKIHRISQRKPTELFLELTHKISPQQNTQNAQNAPPLVEPGSNFIHPSINLGYSNTKGWSLYAASDINHGEVLAKIPLDMILQPHSKIIPNTSLNDITPQLSEKTSNDDTGTQNGEGEVNVEKFNLLLDLIPIAFTKYFTHRSRQGDIPKEDGPGQDNLRSSKKSKPDTPTPQPTRPIDYTIATQTNFMFRLLIEKKMGPKSQFYEMIQTLPTDYPEFSFLDQTSPFLAENSNSMLHNLTKSQQELFKEMIETLRQISVLDLESDIHKNKQNSQNYLNNFTKNERQLSLFDILFKEMQFPNMMNFIEELIWAFYTVNSFSMKINGFSDDNNTEPEQLSGTGIIPLIHLMNTDIFPNCQRGILSQSDLKNYHTLTSTRDVKLGEELTIPYYPTTILKIPIISPHLTSSHSQHAHNNTQEDISDLLRTSLSINDLFSASLVRYPPAYKFAQTALGVDSKLDGEGNTISTKHAGEISCVKTKSGNSIHFHNIPIQSHHDGLSTVHNYGFMPEFNFNEKIPLYGFNTTLSRYFTPSYYYLSETSPSGPKSPKHRSYFPPHLIHELADQAQLDAAYDNLTNPRSGPPLPQQQKPKPLYSFHTPEPSQTPTSSRINPRHLSNPSDRLRLHANEPHIHADPLLTFQDTAPSLRNIILPSRYPTSPPHYHKNEKWQYLKEIVMEVDEEIRAFGAIETKEGSDPESIAWGKLWKRLKEPALLGWNGPTPLLWALCRLHAAGTIFITNPELDPIFHQDGNQSGQNMNQIDHLTRLQSFNIVYDRVEMRAHDAVERIETLVRGKYGIDPNTTWKNIPKYQWLDILTSPYSSTINESPLGDQYDSNQDLVEDEKVNNSNSDSGTMTFFGKFKARMSLLRSPVEKMPLIAPIPKAFVDDCYIDDERMEFGAMCMLYFMLITQVQQMKQNAHIFDSQRGDFDGYGVNCIDQDGVENIPSQSFTIPSIIHSLDHVFALIMNDKLQTERNELDVDGIDVNRVDKMGDKNPTEDDSTLHATVLNHLADYHQAMLVNHSLKLLAVRLGLDQFEHFDTGDTQIDRSNPLQTRPSLRQNNKPNSANYQIFYPYVLDGIVASNQAYYGIVQTDHADGSNNKQGITNNNSSDETQKGSTKLAVHNIYMVKSDDFVKFDG